jgi:hypothetical protein
MKNLLLVLALLPTALTAQPQEAEVVVTFDRSTAAYEAQQLVTAVAPQAVTFGDGFTPLLLSVRLDAPPPPQALSALFESGAISVEVVRTAAQIAAWAGGTDFEEVLAAWAGTDVEEIEALAIGAPTGYLVRVGYASATPTDQAAAAFASALEAEPTTVEKDANELRFRVPESTVPSVAERLQSSAGVVAVRVE